MLTLRFPSNLTVTYNTAKYLLRTSDGYHLYTEKGGRWIASVQLSAGVVVEAVPSRTSRHHAESSEEAAKHLRPSSGTPVPLLPQVPQVGSG